MAVRRRSRKSDLPAAVWIQRIREFQTKVETRKAEREYFRRMLAVPAYDDASVQLALPEAERMVGIISHRLLVYYQGHCYDEIPTLNHPRIGLGDEKFAPMIEQFCTKKLERAQASEEYRKGVPDIMTDGGFVMWHGVPRFPSPSDVSFQNLNGAEAVNLILNHEGYEIQPGMSHRRLATHLRMLASNREAMLGKPLWFQASLLEHASDHDAMDSWEEEQPHDWVRQDGEWWCERSSIGPETTWSVECTDARKSPWMAHLLVLPLAVAREMDSFDKDARGLLEARQTADREKSWQDAPYLTEEDRSASLDLTAVWHIFDREHETQHLVPDSNLTTRDVEPFYLEGDERYPYTDLATMEPVLEGYFPADVVVPYRSNRGTWEDSIGIPLMRLAMDQIVRIADYEIEAHRQVHRNVRVFGFHQDIDSRTRARITEGEDGVGFVMTPQMWRDDTRGVGVRMMGIEGVSADLKMDRDRAWKILDVLTGVSHAALMGEASSETVGQDKIIERHRMMQTGDLVGVLERSWANLAMGCRDISRLHVKSSEVRQMLGDGYVIRSQDGGSTHLWDLYLKTGVTYDRMTTKIARSFRDEDLARAEIIIKAVTVALKVSESRPDMAMDLWPLMRELWRSFALGEPQKMGPEQMAALMGVAEGGGVEDPYRLGSRPGSVNDKAREPDEGKAAGAVGRRLPRTQSVLGSGSPVGLS